jgi:hypothetical protein
LKPNPAPWLSVYDNQGAVGDPIDHSLDTLLEFDGQVFVIDPKGEHWVKFQVRRFEVTPDRPHGLKYSLTLHDAKG